MSTSFRTQSLAGSQRRPKAASLHLRWILLVLLLLPFLGGAGYIAIKVCVREYRRFIIWQGVRLNRQAWEACFTERHLPLPPSGPRDGYWGAHLGKHTEHPVLGWILPALHVPGLLDIDEHGLQRVPSPGAKLGLLIVGASVAFGGGASDIENTYYFQLGKLLNKDGCPVDTTVCATGAWKSIQEVKALRLYGLSVHPDIVIFLNGLNDLTNGSNAYTLFGTPTKTLDGSRWNLLYNEHDYRERVRLYLENMREARNLLRRDNVEVVFALQPALFEKEPLSRMEQKLLRNSLPPYGSKESLKQGYQDIRVGLMGLTRSDGADFIDCSRIFSNERATTFIDLWHFNDPGQHLLAEYLAIKLRPIIEKRARR